jgi:predicted DNA-binding transcriptional regulator AlpA
MKIDDNVLTESEIARVVGVSVSGLRNWRREGSGPPYIRIGSRLIRYSAHDVQAWLDERKEGGK